MNSSFRQSALVFLAASSLLAGCATSTISRIDANRAAYESWPLEMQEAVLSNKVKVGMTAEMVEMSVGRPTEKISRSATGDDEVWVYRKGGGGGSILKNTGISIGGGVGGVGVSTGTSMGGGGGAVPEEREVVLQNGVVIRSDF